MGFPEMAKPAKGYDELFMQRPATAGDVFLLLPGSILRHCRTSAFRAAVEGLGMVGLLRGRVVWYKRPGSVLEVVKLERQSE